MRKYSYAFILILTTFVYGIHMLEGNTFLRILEPPLRTILVFGLIGLPLLSAFFINRGWINGLRRSIIGLTSLWFMVTTFYIIHPIPNGGWVLSGSLSLYALNILWRGDWRE